MHASCAAICNKAARIELVSTDDSMVCGTVVGGPPSVWARGHILVSRQPNDIVGGPVTPRIDPVPAALEDETQRYAIVIEHLRSAAHVRNAVAAAGAARQHETVQCAAAASLRL